jgi:hypothetical protein
LGRGSGAATSVRSGSTRTARRSGRAFMESGATGIRQAGDAAGARVDRLGRATCRGTRSAYRRAVMGRPRLADNIKATSTFLEPAGGAGMGYTQD